MIRFKLSFLLVILIFLVGFFISFPHIALADTQSSATYIGNDISAEIILKAQAAGVSTPLSLAQDSNIKNATYAIVDSKVFESVPETSDRLFSYSCNLLQNSTDLSICKSGKNQKDSSPFALNPYLGGVVSFVLLFATVASGRVFVDALVLLVFSIYVAIFYLHPRWYLRLSSGISPPVK